MHQALATGQGAGGGTGADSLVDGGIVALAQADTSNVITFAAAFTAKPAVNAKLLSPTGGTTIDARIDYSTLTTTGMTVRFSAIPASGWQLSWQAVGN